MSVESREVRPYDRDPTTELTLEWANRQFDRITDVLSTLTDGTGSKLKYIKLVGGTDVVFGTPYVLSDYHHVVLVDPNGQGAIEIQLPKGVNQKRFHIKHIGPAPGGPGIIITTDSVSEFIDQEATYSLAHNEAISPMYLAEDSSWYIL